MDTAPRFHSVVLNAVAMAIVTGLSLLVLIYVGHGEAKRTYQQFQIEKLVAQGQILQTTLDTFLRSGYAIRQFVGFATKAEPILASDDSIAAMTVFDRNGDTVFASGDSTIRLLPKPSKMQAGASDNIDLRTDQQFLQVVLPLRNRFEEAGSLAITMPVSVISDRVEKSFEPLVIGAAIAAGAFGIFVALFAPMFRGKRRRWLQYAYALTFLTASVFVIATLISLYSEGAQAKTKALADSLGQRLTSIVQFGLNITEIRGIEQMLDDYQRLNPDISAAGLSVDGIVTFHTNKDAVGKPWVRDRRNHEYVVDLSRKGGRDIQVAVAIPANVVYRQILRSVKNFAALFVASAFAAGIFLQLAGSVDQARSLKDPSDGKSDELPVDRAGHEAALKLVKPVFFVAVVVEHLTYAFLPQYMYQIVQSAGLPAGTASLPFMIYYLCFAASLVPAGHFAQHNTPRPLMCVGMCLAGIGLALLALYPDFYIVLAARALSGIGQGMLFIGVQSYILLTSAENRKTQGAAIIVFGFQGGMVSGMAIGSLLVTQMGPSGVFILAASIAAVMAIYTVVIVPQVSQRAMLGAGQGGTLRVLFRDLSQVLRSFDFLRTMILIGIPAKAVLTGVIIFALPVLMEQAHYAQEDIGQILMIYAAAVMIASGYVSRIVDRTGKTDYTLFTGSLISGAGLILIGFLGWGPVSALSLNGTVHTLLLIAGVTIVGLAHGFINAPVVTHVANSRLAAATGESSATAAYRFLERIGHVAGPIIVGQLFLIGGQTTTVVAWIGAAVMGLSLLFLITVAPARIRYES